MHSQESIININFFTNTSRVSHIQLQQHVSKKKKEYNLINILLHYNFDINQTKKACLKCRPCIFPLHSN